MQLQEIREEIINQLKSDIDNYNDVLSETNPGNYGINHWEVEIDEKHFYVDIPNKEFNFHSCKFYSNLVMGASKGDSSFDMSYNKPMNGNGKFEFKDSKSIFISEINIEIDKNIFQD